MHIVGLDHIVLAVAVVERTKAFYERVLGMKAIEQRPGQWALEVGRNRISLQNALFRRDCYPDPQWFDPRAKANADWEFTVRLVQHTKVCEDPEPVVFAYVSDDSISSSGRKKLTGLLAVLNKNREVFSRYRPEFALNIMRLGKMLFRIGKRRAGMRYVLMSIRMDPTNLRYLMPSRVRRLLPGGAAA